MAEIRWILHIPFHAPNRTVFPLPSNCNAGLPHRKTICSGRGGQYHQKAVLDTWLEACQFARSAHRCHYNDVLLPKLSMPLRQNLPRNPVQIHIRREG